MEKEVAAVISSSDEDDVTRTPPRKKKRFGMSNNLATSGLMNPSLKIGLDLMKVIGISICAWYVIPNLKIPIGML